MSTYEQQPSHFTLWRKDFFADPPILDEYKDSQAAHERSLCEVERLLLGLDVEEIKQKLIGLGIDETASTHTIHRPDGYTTAYIERTHPVGLDKSNTFIRINVNAITNHSKNERTAELEEYFVDLAEYSVRVYRGSASGDLMEWTIENGSPPFISRHDGLPAFEAGHNYSPLLPTPITETTNFEEINKYRQEATILINFLNQLDEVSEDLRIPYAQP